MSYQPPTGLSSPYPVPVGVGITHRNLQSAKHFTLAGGVNTVVLNSADPNNPATVELHMVDSIGNDTVAATFSQDGIYYFTAPNAQQQCQFYAIFAATNVGNLLNFSIIQTQYAGLRDG